MAVSQPPRAAERARMLRHPGVHNPVRIESRRCAAPRHARLTLAPGARLHDAIVKPLAAAGVRSASMTILGGAFARLLYCVAPPDPEGASVVRYSDPIDAGASRMIFGNATLGFCAAGEPLVHCHATLIRADGAARGGHILTDQAIIGAAPITALVTAFEAFELHQRYDPETRMSLLQPVAKASDDARRTQSAELVHG